MSKREGGFGFRELQDFNSSMLAVMVARITSEPNNLWAQVMKGIYFPSVNFFQAGKGVRVSWGWTSILHERDILQRHGA